MTEQEIKEVNTIRKRLHEILQGHVFTDEQAYKLRSFFDDDIRTRVRFRGKSNG